MTSCVFPLSFSLSPLPPSPRGVGTLSRCTRTGGVHGREAIVIRENLTLTLDTKEMRMEVIMLRNRGGGALTLSRIRFPLILDSLDCYLMEEEGRLFTVVARVIFKAKRMLRLNYGHRYIHRYPRIILVIFYIFHRKDGKAVF